MIFDVPLAPAVEARLREVLVQRGHPLLLSFDRGWRLRDVRGDAAFHGIDAASPERGVQQLQDLFIGLALDDDQHIPFVELASGRSAHVHLIADGEGFHVLLVDAEEARSRGIVLDQGTSMSGGRLEHLLSSMSLQPSLDRVAADLEQQYHVVYGRPGTLVPPKKIEVSVTRPGVKVRWTPAATPPIRWPSRSSGRPRAACRPPGCRSPRAA